MGSSVISTQNPALPAFPLPWKMLLRCILDMKLSVLCGVRYYRYCFWYAKWVKRSRTEDFSDMIKLQFLYQSGVDFMGRPIVVFVARNFPAQSIDMNKAVSYFVHIMDAIASREYVVVYFHTLATEDNALSMSFLRDMYEMLDIKFRLNLRSIFVVHGSLWDRIITWFFTVFSAATIKDQIKFLSGVQYLYDYINPEQLQIPPFVLEYDVQENGPNYYAPGNPYRVGAY
eukprot:gene17526-9150_t